MISGKKVVYDHCTMIHNDMFGIEVTYTGQQQLWQFFLYPQLDQNNQTIRYYAFDDILQKTQFEQLLKLPWIGGKTAYHIASLPHNLLEDAVEKMDVAFFQSLPWVWPKTAKRLLLELKQTVSKDDMMTLSGDPKIAQDITKSLQSLWYQQQTIKLLLPDVPYRFEKEHIPDIMKRLIDHM